MVNYRVFDDNGEIESVHLNDTIVLRESTTMANPAGSDGINRLWKVPKDSSGNYANRLHLSCREEGDYGVVIQKHVATCNDSDGGIDLYDDTINFSYKWPVACYDLSEISNVPNVDPSFILDYTTFSDSTAVANNIETEDGITGVFVVNQVRTNKINISIPIKATTANETILFEIDGLSNNKLDILWTIEG